MSINPLMEKLLTVEPLGELPGNAEIEKVLSRMIISASGWRSVFAGDGTNENDPDTHILPECKVILTLAAANFCRYLREVEKVEAPAIILGSDTRPTSPEIMDVLARAFIALGASVQFLFYTAAPEIMAYSKVSGAYADGLKTDGFCYVSASHNPIGHNGLKFGLSREGSVIGGAQAAALIASFKELMNSAYPAADASAILAKCDVEKLRAAYAAGDANKERARNAYLLFTKEVVCNSALASDQDAFFRLIRSSLQHEPIGIISDMNGSARTTTIDRALLSELGAKFFLFNDTPGKIAHRIVPEGESLEPCRLALAEKHKEDPAYVMGYVPDCDGDRGNIVIYDEVADTFRILAAQEVFALCVVAELAQLEWDRRYTAKDVSKPIAVVVNDPTSFMVKEICDAFGAELYVAEVGEACVVGKAREVRSQGKIVRILGEGSAGGNITFPSSVRDPIDTVFALLKLLAVKETGHTKGLFQLWCEKSHQEYAPNYGIGRVISTLPRFFTTGAYEKEAALRIKTKDQPALKSKFQKIFEKEWELKAPELKAYGITSYEVRAYNGPVERLAVEDFGSSGKGGLKIVLLGAASRPEGFMWMRGSATEPVFRVMADARTREAERMLINWLDDMVLRADSL